MVRWRREKEKRDGVGQRWWEMAPKRRKRPADGVPTTKRKRKGIRKAVFLVYKKWCGIAPAPVLLHGETSENPDNKVPPSHFACPSPCLCRRLPLHYWPYVWAIVRKRPCPMKSLPPPPSCFFIPHLLPISISISISSSHLYI